MPLKALFCRVCDEKNNVKCAQVGSGDGETIFKLRIASSVTARDIHYGTFC